MGEEQKGPPTPHEQFDSWAKAVKERGAPAKDLNGASGNLALRAG